MDKFEITYDGNLRTSAEHLDSGSIINTDAIVCNIGDMMQLVTDKKLKSTTHRVIQDKQTESKPRYSIPFFLHPAPSVILKSVFREDDKGVLADDFLNQRLKEIKLY